MAMRAIETAEATQDIHTLRAINRFIELSRLPLSDAQQGLLAGASFQLEHGNLSGFQECVTAASAFNSEIFRSATAGWSVEEQIRFAHHFVNTVDFDYFAQVSYNEQLRIVQQTVDPFLKQEGIAMSQGDICNMSAAMATAMVGELRGADLETMEKVWAARDMDELRTAATYLSFAERNALSSFLEGAEMGAGTEIEKLTQEVIARMIEEVRTIAEDMEFSRKLKEDLDKVIEEENEKNEAEKYSSIAEAIPEQFLATVGLSEDSKTLAEMLSGVREYDAGVVREILSSNPELAENVARFFAEA
ncbi:MAG: hypothetical protein AB1657_03305 [Candidatus Micrarchaeota archaeon]